MAERQALRDAVKVGRMNDGSFAETAEALGVFGLRQMAATGGIVHGFAGGGDFEPLGHGFLGFDAFGTSHKINSFAKERGIYMSLRLKASEKFLKYACRRKFTVCLYSSATAKIAGLTPEPRRSN